MPYKIGETFRLGTDRIITVTKVINHPESTIYALMDKKNWKLFAVEAELDRLRRMEYERIQLRKARDDQENHMS